MSKRCGMAVQIFSRVVTQCSAWAKSREGGCGELFNVRSKLKFAVNSSWGAEGIGRNLYARQDDCPGPRCGDCRYSTVRVRGGRGWCDITFASRAC